MAINIPWSAFGFESEEDKRRRLLQEREQTRQTLLGAKPVAPQLVEYGDRMMLNAPSTEGSGFLGSDMKPMAQSNYLGGMLEAGYSPQEASGLLGIAQQQTPVETNMGIFKDPNQYASQLTDLSDRQFKAVQPFQQAALGFNQIKNLMTDENGNNIPVEKLGGNFDLALQRNFIKGMAVLRPEAYMQDDAVQAFMASQNIGDFAQLKNYFMGDIKLDYEGRKKMLKAYNSIMKDNFKAMESVGQPFERQRELLFPGTPRETLFGESIGKYGKGLIDTTEKMSYQDWKASKGY